MKKLHHEGRNWFKIIFIAVIGLAIFLIWYFMIGFSANKHGSFFNKGHNAVWLGHEWVGQSKSEGEIRTLVENLRNHQIDTVFVHAGPLKEDGSIDPKTYEFAFEFIERAGRLDGKIEYQAWLGQVRSKIDLADSVVRHNIAKQAIILAGLTGFDGVHFDIEPVWDDDKDFIELLKETRNSLPADKKISVALAEFIPRSLIWLMENVHEFENFNSEVNYENVAEYADQIVVMAYDTGIDRPWLYRWLVREQTIWLTNLLKDSELFIGIPAYEDEKDSFNPDVENVENGLSGIIAGLNNFRSEEENFGGVAIYPYWEVDANEWGTYEELWGK